MKERNNLPAGTGSSGGEVIAACSAGDFVLYRPRYSLRVVGIGGNIGKISLASGRGASSRFPHIFHRHDAGTIGVRSEVDPDTKPFSAAHRAAL